jgi:hypothetical protein
MEGVPITDYLDAPVLGILIGKILWDWLKAKRNGNPNGMLKEIKTLAVEIKQEQAVQKTSFDGMGGKQEQTNTCLQELVKASVKTNTLLEGIQEEMRMQRIGNPGPRGS